MKKQQGLYVNFLSLKTAYTTRGGSRGETNKKLQCEGDRTIREMILVLNLTMVSKILQDPLFESELRSTTNVINMHDAS